MTFKSIKTICFSPTGTTRKVLNSVTDAIECSDKELIDITAADARSRKLTANSDELLIVGMPVYSGRLPPLAAEWLRTLRTQKSPTVCIAVYGNRTFDDALLELSDIMRECGCVVLGAAAFIGEHSFSSKLTPIAVKRPDDDDLQQAHDFGRRINAKLATLSTAEQIENLELPGNRPYKTLKAMPTDDFVTISSKCTHCGACAKACPVEAIAEPGGTLPDMSRCIFCCACIKVCPVDAITMRPGAIMDVAKRLHQNCTARQPVALWI